MAVDGTRVSKQLANRRKALTINASGSDTAGQCTKSEYRQHLRLIQVEALAIRDFPGGDRGERRSTAGAIITYRASNVLISIAEYGNTPIRPSCSGLTSAK